MDDCLQYIGGTAGVVALSSVAAATAYYYATRPSPQTPLVPLDNQSPVLDVSRNIQKLMNFFCLCIYYYKLRNEMKK